MERKSVRPVAAIVRNSFADFAALPEIETVERLIGEQDRVRGQQAEREQHALALAL